MSIGTGNPQQVNAKALADSAVEDVRDSPIIVAVEQHASRRTNRQWWRRLNHRTLRCAAVALDMSNIDTTPNRQTIACLVRFLYKCARRSCRVAICNASPETMVVFEIYGVPHLANLFDNVPSAAAFLHTRTERHHED